MSFLSEVVNSIDTSGEQKADIRESLDLLVELTKAKAVEIEAEIKDKLNKARLLTDETEMSFPISKVMDTRIEYRCLTPTSPSNLVEQIENIISGMIENSITTGIVKGIASLIDVALHPILGLSEGSERCAKCSTAFIDGIGFAANMVRFDCIIWGRAVMAESIKTSIDKTLACVAYKSVIDVTKLSFDDFRAVYAPVLEASGETDILVAIKRAKEVYEALDGGAELNPLNNTLLVKQLDISNLISHSEPLTVIDSKF